MKRVLFDSNIILDISLKRNPFRETSETAFLKLVSTGTVILAPHSFATIHYLNERYQNSYFAISFTKALLDTVRVCDFTHDDAVAALGFNSGDYEDALIIAAAVSAGADAIVTRNAGDFDRSPVQVLTPGELLANRMSFS
jgi:predicted nucleic acid-binding protein